MTKFTKVGLDITEYKPKMKPFYIAQTADLRAIPVKFGQTASVQVKADGEFNYIHIDRNQIYAVNRFGRKTEDLPALNELHEIFKKTPIINEMDILAEMYAVDMYGHPLPLPMFIHYLKGENKALQESIHLGIFEFVKGGVSNVIGFSPSKTMNSIHQFSMLKRLNGKLCHVLDYIVPKNWEDVEKFWVEKVQKEGYEGLVIRVNGDTYKAKPNRDVDAVIIGINKNNKGYAKGLAKSVKVALMPTENSFVELGDATVPTDAEASALFDLTRVKLNEDANTAFVKPLVVVQIDYISLFPETVNRVYKMFLGGFMEVGTMKAARMKSPRVKGYRRDKHACTTDIGLTQIEEN